MGVVKASTCTMKTASQTAWITAVHMAISVQIPMER